MDVVAILPSLPHDTNVSCKKCQAQLVKDPSKHKHPGRAVAESRFTNAPGTRRNPSRRRLQNLGSCCSFLSRHIAWSPCKVRPVFALQVARSSSPIPRRKHMEQRHNACAAVGLAIANSRAALKPRRLADAGSERTRGGKKTSRVRSRH